MVRGKRILLIVLVFAAGLGGAWFVAQMLFKPQAEQKPRLANLDDRLRLWWEGVPRHVRKISHKQQKPSNILPGDYVGPESCKECHKDQYHDWSEHPHRFMNAMAVEDRVVGDFADKEMSYLGGTARFYQENGKYRMHFRRGDVERFYAINQTIGSRFTQYYVGKLLKGPEPKGHQEYTTDHVMPFGYWIDEKMWVPVVHVGDEEPDGKRPDPFAAPGAEPGLIFDPYTSCNVCHTTFALGDDLLRKSHVLSPNLPAKINLNTSAYLKKAHPKIWNGRSAKGMEKPELVKIMRAVRSMEAPGNAVNLGISCEACHLGAKAHAEGKLTRPSFLPQGKQVFLEHEGDLDFGRNAINVNWVCSRCHSGQRPTYANGVNTWNSTEHADASKGHCYPKLTCIQCHDPHQKTGKVWSATPDEDDANCLSCHEKFESAPVREAHTHHSSGSSGSRCMNCHMPRLNEGLQDMVRTHTIFSPTDSAMLEANQPNACNMCHVKESIDWTLKNLKEWYGKEYDEEKVAKQYPDRKGSVALGWLKAKQDSVRLVGADSLIRSNAKWATEHLVNALNDPYLINRQFAARGLERMYKFKVGDHGYRFFMTPAERKKPIEKIRAAVLK